MKHPVSLRIVQALAAISTLLYVGHASAQLPPRPPIPSPPPGTVPQVCPAYTTTPVANPGSFSPPFAEPTVDNQTTAGKCVTDSTSGKQVCKPAAVSVAVLNTGSGPGKVVYFNGLEDTENVQYSIVFEINELMNDQTRTLDLNGPTWTVPSPSDAGGNPGGNNNELLLPAALTYQNQGNQGALFCADLVQLADGKIMAAGGTSYYSEPGNAQLGVGIAELEGLKNTRIYDPVANTWAQSGAMSYGRWYPGLVTLADGHVLVASGVSKLIKPIYPDRPSDSGRNVTQTELFTPPSGTWSLNPATAWRSLPLFPRLHLLPNGMVYYNAAGQSFNPFGQSYDQALWGVVAAYDPVAQSWMDLGVGGLPLDAGKQPTGDPSILGAIAGAGFRGSTFSIMMPLKPDSSGNYGKAEFLMAGGVLNGGALDSPGSYFAVPWSRIDTVNIGSGGALTHRARATGNLNFARWYSTGVLLPDGSVIAFNGSDRDEVDMPGVECPIQQSERFDPVSETWAPVAISHDPRTYHNTAALLPDGTVLVGGHAPISTAYGFDYTVPGGFAPHDGRDPSFEIYSPPYTASSLSRPVISTVGPSTQIPIGSTIEVTIPASSPVPASAIDSVVLIRNTALTHLVDGDQRMVELKLTASNPVASVKASIPNSHSVLPAGPYLLFARTTQGGIVVPSAGVQVTVAP